MDTWATSSLTPQIAGHWVGRPRSLRARLPDEPTPAVPRDHPHLALLDPRALGARARGAPVVRGGDLGLGARPESGRKMSKSTRQGRDPRRTSEEVTGPMPSGTGRHLRDPESTLVLDEAQLKVGRRLAIKVLNASRFCLSVLSEGPVPDYSEIRAPIDLALVARLASCDRRSRHRVRRARLRACPRADRVLLLVVLRRLRRAREEPRVLRRSFGDGDLREGHARARAVGASPASSRRYFRSSPKRSGPGGTRAPSTEPRGRPQVSCQRPQVTRACSRLASDVLGRGAKAEDHCQSAG